MTYRLAGGGLVCCADPVQFTSSFKAHAADKCCINLMAPTARPTVSPTAPEPTKSPSMYPTKKPQNRMTTQIIDMSDTDASRSRFKGLGTGGTIAIIFLVLTLLGAAIVGVVYKLHSTKHKQLNVQDDDCTQYGAGVRSSLIITDSIPMA